MELSNEFTVALPVDAAWEVLTDLERIAPCMPGAQLQEIEGDEYRGIVKVKVGPITAQYKGKATFVERDEAAHRATLRAEGRETTGKGNASATITATLTTAGTGTHVLVVTDLTITGKVAQFGRGVLADVSGKLLTQFVESLEATVLASPEAAASAPTPAPEPEAAPEPAPAVADEPASAVAAEPASAVAAEPASAAAAEPVHAKEAPKVRVVDHAAPKPVDLLETAGAPVAKRVAPVLAVLALLWLLRQFLRRNKKT
jgi:carbon monoxide dehydrogenase subunit G